MLVTAKFTAEFSRVYYHDGAYTVGATGARVGSNPDGVAHYVIGCDVDHTGAVVMFQTGHRVHLPPEWYVLTWRP